ncbi:MAG: LysM peptidoglycan-binding domain-containing protein [Chloroflexi bacterium]|nr:LysM peptidoglycan-binding domain-containing protein [Chloroflexota bacterium]
MNHLTLFDLSVRASAATGPTRYTVQPGDNLFRISLRFGVTVAAIQAANGLTSWLIYAGQELIIPGATGVAPTPMPAPPATPAPGPPATYIV